MFVSVVIPTKDRPIPVVNAVRSVFAGSYQHFELFVVDQSADESTRDALALFTTDPRFHYLQNRRPGYGASSSRNTRRLRERGRIGPVPDRVVGIATNATAASSAVRAAEERGR